MELSTQPKGKTGGRRGSLGGSAWLGHLAELPSIGDARSSGLLKAPQRSRSRPAEWRPWSWCRCRGCTGLSPLRSVLLSGRTSAAVFCLVSSAVVFEAYSWPSHPR